MCPLSVFTFGMSDDGLPQWDYPVPWKFLHVEKIRIRRIEITKVVENNFLKHVSKFRV